MESGGRNEYLWRRLPAVERIDDPGSPDGEALAVPSRIIRRCIIAGRYQIFAEPMQMIRMHGFCLPVPVTNMQTLLVAKELGLETKSMGRKAQVSR